MTDSNQSHAVAKAIHDVLSSDVAVQSLLGVPARLYDHPPEDPIFPYLSYGPMRSTDIGGDTTPLTTHSLTLHLWSRYSGRAEILQCLSVVSEVLEGGNFQIENAHIVSANIIFSDHLRAPDVRTLHGLLRLNVTTQPI